MVLAFPNAWARFDDSRKMLGPTDQPVATLRELWAEGAGLTERYIEVHAGQLFSAEICNIDTGEVSPHVIKYLEGK